MRPFLSRGLLMRGLLTRGLLMRGLLMLALLAGGAGCGRGGASGEADANADATDAAAVAPSLLPQGYAAGFVEVRGCRNSIDHDLNHIVIKADPASAPAYLSGPFPLPVGSLIIKEEFSDRGCTALTGYTLMRKEAGGYEDRYGDWHWQRLDATGRVLADGKGVGGTVTRCASCHAAAACKARDFTCAEP